MASSSHWHEAFFMNQTDDRRWQRVHASKKENNARAVHVPRLSFEHSKTAEKSNTRGHSGYSDARQVFEVKSVQQVFRVRVDVDRLLLDG